MTFSQKIKKKGTILSIVSTEPLPLTKWNFSKKKFYFKYSLLGGNMRTPCLV